MAHAPRRNADGSLDIDHYRRRARRLRYLARRQAVRRLRGAVAALGGMLARAAPLRAWRWAGAIALAALPAAAEPAPGGFIATPVHIEAAAGGIFRLYRLELGPGTATLPAAPPGEEVVSCSRARSSSKPRAPRAAFSWRAR